MTGYGDLYATGYRNGHADTLLGRQSRYAMADQGSYGVGYRVAQAEAARAGYERTLIEYRKTEFRA